MSHSHWCTALWERMGTLGVACIRGTHVRMSHALTLLCHMPQHCCVICLVHAVPHALYMLCHLPCTCCATCLVHAVPHALYMLCHLPCTCCVICLVHAVYIHTYIYIYMLCHIYDGHMVRLLFKESEIVKMSRSPDCSTYIIITGPHHTACTYIHYWTPPHGMYLHTYVCTHIHD